MVGSLVDTIESPRPYLIGTKAGAGITSRMIAILPKIKAIIADHPAPTTDRTRTPDVDHY